MFLVEKAALIASTEYVDSIVADVVELRVEPCKRVATPFLPSSRYVIFCYACFDFCPFKPASVRCC